MPPKTYARLDVRTALLMLAIVGLTNIVNAMDRIVFGVLLPNVNRDYGFSLEQGGFLATIFTLGIALSGIPTGYILDRYSRKSVILGGMLAYSILTILTALSRSFVDMATYRALSGLGEGMQNIAIFTAVGSYFFANRAAAIGTMNLAYGVGLFAGPALGGYILSVSGDWRIPLLIYGAIGLLLMILAWFTVSKRFTEQQIEGASDSSLSAKKTMPDGVLHRNVFISLVCGVIVGVCYGYIGLYPTFLRADLHFTAAQTGLAAGMFGLGAMFGMPAGYLADRYDQRTIGIVAVIVMAVSAYAIFNLAVSPLAQFLLSLAFGAATSGFFFVNTHALIQRSVKPELVGRAAGLLVTFIYLPGSISGYTFALLRSNYGWGSASTVQIVVPCAVALLALLFLDTGLVRKTVRS